MSPYAGLIFDDSSHYLDHLGPFCSLAGCPLLVCEPEIADLATRVYPDLQVQLISLRALKLPKWTITCDTRPLLRAYFPGQSTQILWLAHGNSDKGFKGPFFEALQGETAFVYGQRMIDFMGAKGVRPKTIRVGNFRMQYYQKKLCACKSKTFLYAPTWDDFEKNNSFWKAFPLLAKNLPKDCNLAVKLHPNTVKKFAPEIESLIGKHSQKNLHFLPDEPPIYPLLSRFEAYIGDMSSIGYDFLAFQRPMFFLNANPLLPLHNCGTGIDPNSFDFSLTNPYSKAQKALYEYTFDSHTDWKRELDALCSL